MSIVIAALAAVAFFASSPLPSTQPAATRIVAPAGQGPVGYDAVLPIG